MFINTFDAPITNKNLPSFWCNALPHRNVVNEPSLRGHNNFMISKRVSERINSYIGKKFNCLTILKKLPHKNGNAYVEAECECGTIKAYVLYTIIKGKSKSCGCYRDGKSMNRQKHRLSKHPLNKVHEAIKRRCTVSKVKNYHNYGGRGVRMCDEWLNDFKAFYDWCMANGWKKGLEIDKDIIANRLCVPADLYSPERCLIVTSKLNSRYRNNNRLIEYGGVTKTLVEWAEQYDMDYYFLRNRLRRGWSMEKAVTTPKIKMGRWKHKYE